MLELLLVAVVNKLYARIDIFELNLAIVGNVCAPLLGIVPDKIIAVSGEPLQRIDVCPVTSAGKLHANHVCGIFSRSEGQHSFILGQKQGVAGTPGEILDSL